MDRITTFDNEELFSIFVVPMSDEEAQCVQDCWSMTHASDYVFTSRHQKSYNGESATNIHEVTVRNFARLCDTESKPDNEKCLDDSLMNYMGVDFMER